MKAKIIEREEIKLSSSQAAMIKSGWGEAVLNNVLIRRFKSTGIHRIP